MSLKSPSELLHQLYDIQLRSQQNAVGLPKQEVKRYWEGVLFTLAGVGMVAPLNEVREILNYPNEVTKVPGTHEWVRGIANVRGNLLPIFDLQQFLGSPAVPIGRRSRVLVINFQGLYAGLLIGVVQGMRHFSEEQVAPVPSLPESLVPFVQNAYELEGVIRPVFSMQWLAENSEFRVAAL